MLKNPQPKISKAATLPTLLIFMWKSFHNNEENSNKKFRNKNYWGSH